MTTTIAIPKAGDLIRTDHHCWWNDPTAEHPATLHNAPIQVDRVVKLGGANGAWRVEATRCDGTSIHLVLDDNGEETLLPWDAARTGIEIVDVEHLPVDPDSLDATRPIDLDECSNCMGQGEVTTWSDGWATCRLCHGTGVRRPS